MANAATGSIRGQASAQADETGPAVIDLGMLPTLVGRQLRLAQLMAFKDFSVEVDGIGLNPGSFEILELLEHNPGIGQSRLATATGLEKSTLVPAIARLAELAFLTRRTSVTDRRAVELRITAKGTAALKRLRIYMRERDARITRALSAPERRELNRLLVKIAESNG